MNFRIFSCLLSHSKIIKTHATTHNFYVGFGDSNSDPHARTASGLFSEPALLLSGVEQSNKLNISK